MSARTNIQSLAGAKVYISAERPASHLLAAYADTGIEWTEVGEVADHGNHGVQAPIIEFTAVDDAVVQKLKGSKNYGTKQMVIGNIPGDAGQTLLKAASESNNRYSMRIDYPLGDNEVTAEKHYMDVLVASFEFQEGTVNNVRKVGVSVALCNSIIVSPAT
jgi:hypothetical protein